MTSEHIQPRSDGARVVIVEELGGVQTIVFAISVPIAYDLFEIHRLVYKSPWHGNSALHQVLICRYPGDRRAVGALAARLLSEIIVCQPGRLLEVGLA